MGTSPRYLGKYELQTLLGYGGMGEVWKAFDTQLQRYVAIKLLHADLRNDPNFVTRFQREAQVIASLHHPNIVQLFDFQTSQLPDSESTICYMVMDYVEGHTLAQYIASTSRVGKYPSSGDIVHLFTPICMAIDYAHQKGMLHRDIKPSNILLDERLPQSRLHSGTHSSIGEPILSDFGIAKLLKSTANTVSSLWLGTAYYTSPEQAKGASSDIHSDLYSLGVVLYELCTGIRPFQGDNPVAIMFQHIHGTPTAPILINPQIPVELNTMILRSIAKEPADRFPSATDMAIALAQSVSIVASQSHPPLQISNSSSTPSGYQQTPPSVSNPSYYQQTPPFTSGSSGTHPISSSHYPPMQEYIKGESLNPLSTITRQQRTSSEPQPAGSTSSGWRSSAPQPTNASAAQAETVPPGQRNSHRRRRALLFVPLALLLLLALIAFPLLYSQNMLGLGRTASNIQAPVPPNGIGVIREPGGEYIGISDGLFAFDTNRTDGAIKAQAAQALKHNDVGAAMSLLNQAIAQDTSDAEALIYQEDLRIVNSGRPYITLVVGTIFTGNSTGRSSLQGAYLAQKESNDGSKLSGGVQVRLLIANTGSKAAYATLVAQQIVQLARTDPHFVGISGWSYSSHTINVIKVLGPAHIPMVSPTASSDLLTNISPYFFRVAPSNNIQAIAGAKYAEQTLKAKTVAMFYDPTDLYSQSLAQDFAEQFKADGNTVVAEKTYTISKPETIPALLQDALTQQPDFIYFSGYSKDVSTLLINLPPGNLPVMGGDALYQLGEYPSSARAGFSHLHFTAFAYPDQWDILGYTNLKPAFFAEYAATYDPNGLHQGSPYGFRRADNGVVLYYDAMLALLKGCDIALGGSQKTITPQDLQQGLSKVNGTNAIQGVSGQIAFAPNGNPIDKAIVILYVDPEGHIKMEPTILGRFLK